MRTQKAFKNIISSLIYQIVAMVCGLITPRLILSAFGSTYNGVIASATQFLSMVSILTMGITASIRVALYSALADNDTTRISRIYKSTQKYMRKIALCAIFVSLILCVIYPYISHNELSHFENAALIIIVSIGTFAEYFFGITNVTLITADQSNYVISLLNIFKVVLNAVFVAILIKCGCNVFQVKLGSSVVYFLCPVILSIYTRKKYSIIKNCLPLDSAITQRKAVAVHSIANIVHNNTDLIILTLFSDAKIISVYTVYYLVYGKVWSIIGVLTNGIEAAFGNIWIKKEYEILRSRFRLFEYVMFSVGAVIFSCISVLILPFIMLYTKRVTDVEYVRLSLAVLITTAEFMFCIRQPYLILVYATGSFEQTKKGAIIEAVLNLCISIALVNIIGIEGVIIGTLVANVFRTIQYVIYTSNYILRRKYTNVILRFTWTLITIMITIIISHLLLPELMNIGTWYEWLLNAFIVLSIAVLSTLTMSILFYKQDMANIYIITKRLIHKRKADKL